LPVDLFKESKRRKNLTQNEKEISIDVSLSMILNTKHVRHIYICPFSIFAHFPIYTDVFSPLFLSPFYITFYEFF